MVPKFLSVEGFEHPQEFQMKMTKALRPSYIPNNDQAIVSTLWQQTLVEYNYDFIDWVQDQSRLKGPGICLLYIVVVNDDFKTFLIKTYYMSTKEFTQTTQKLEGKFPDFVQFKSLQVFLDNYHPSSEFIVFVNNNITRTYGATIVRYDMEFSL